MTEEADILQGELVKTHSCKFGVFGVRDFPKPRNIGSHCTKYKAQPDPPNN